MTRHPIILAVCAILSACAGTGVGPAASGKATIGTTVVSYDPIPALQGQTRPGLTPLLFRFTDTGPRSTNGVTDADWARAAQTAGMAVSDLKSSVYGGSAYKTASGDLAACTMLAISRGLCAGPEIMPVARRAALAEQVLSGSACRWVGFDPAFNAAQSRRMGADDFILVAQADCV